MDSQYFVLNIKSKRIKIMTQLFLSQNVQLQNSLKQFILPGIQNAEQIKAHLLSVRLDSDQQIAKLNTFLQKQIRLLLTEIMGKGSFDKVGKLIGLLCDVSIQQKYGRTHLEKPLIKQSLAIIIVEDLLECLGINDLKQILPTITEKICSFKQLDANDQNRMLRIVNHLLKRISKTEDYLIRGQLQFTLTKILPICHDSGFHYRIPIAKGIQIAEDQQAQQYKAAFNSEGITYQFYKDFWELQKYLMDPNELSSEQSPKNGSEQTPKKPISAFKTEPLISLRLKQIERVLNDVITYMAKNPCSQRLTDLLAQPIKFLTNTHLLEFQLNDEYFRKIIVLQILVFTFTLKHLKPTGNILKNVMLTEVQRQTINKIESIALKCLQSLQKNQITQKQQGPQNQNSQSSLLQVMKAFFSNELEWLQLKDHWKEKKKLFLRTQVSAPEPQSKEKKVKQGIDYNKKIAEIHSKIADQMNIQGDTLLKFLTEPCVPHIVTTPTQTSFAYFWSQGKTCLDGFDFENSQQHQFETKSEYNMYEWKALRSLYKESVKDISLGERNPKLREYKALAFIENKEKSFKDKPNQTNPEILVPTESKTGDLPPIQQGSERQQISKEKPVLEGSPKRQLYESNGQGQEEQMGDPAPLKKQKSD